ncbi:MAG: hypothetical protein WC028_14190 [Candidatus Obscuribacterales bacterium]
MSPVSLISLRKIVSTSALCALIACTTSSNLAQGAEQQQPYLVMNQANKISPMLGATTSEKDLIAYFGTKNVKRKTVHVAEGETSNGTVIYPNDPKRRVTFIWKNVKKRDLPEVIRIEDQPSLWILPNRITTGTTLIELEKMNGKVFKMSGFDWDYGGNILSWNNGKLESLLKSKSGKVSATACLAPPKDKNSSDELSGDKEILSSNASMRKLNPVVVTISILAP